MPSGIRWKSLNGLKPPGLRLAYGKSILPLILLRREERPELFVWDLLELRCLSRSSSSHDADAGVRESFSWTRADSAVQSISLLLWSHFVYDFPAGKLGAAAMERCLRPHHVMCVHPHRSAAIWIPTVLTFAQGLTYSWCVTYHQGERCSETLTEKALSYIF